MMSFIPHPDIERFHCNWRAWLAEGSPQVIEKMSMRLPGLGE